MADEKLTEQQDRFCLEFVKDLNGKQAAIRAEYSEKSAESQASRLLRNAKVSARIRGLMKSRAKRLQITGDMVVQRLANIAFGHLGMICIWTDNGLDLKDTSELSEEEMSIISELNISPISDGDGGLLGYNKKVKLKDSLKALEMLSKHLGLLDGQGAERKNTGVIKEKLLEVVGRLGG